MRDRLLVTRESLVVHPGERLLDDVALTGTNSRAISNNIDQSHAKIMVGRNTNRLKEFVEVW